MLNNWSRWACAMGIAVLGLACVPEAHAAVDAAIPMGSRLVRFLGRFHVVLVHFPIALLIGAAAAEGLALATGADRLRAGAKFFVVLGSLAAVGAATLGWFAAGSSGTPEALSETMEMHRWLGTATALWTVVVVALMVRATERGTPEARALYVGALVAGAALVGASGHFGGMLVHGTNHFVW